MADKILCPWCGAEMRTITAHLEKNDKTKKWNAWMACKNFECQAEGPFVQESSLEEAEDSAKAAALRRYAPLLKPMTLEEVRENDNGQMWLELSNPKHAYMQGYCELIIFRLFDGDEQFDFYPCGSDMVYEYKAKDYNREWRCWERKPTDEERSAAEWEN